MDKVAERALLKLLSQAESAWASGGAGRALSLPFTESKLPAYFEFGTHADRTVCNATLMLAERAHAITIDWDPRSGDKRQVLRITLISADKLATFLEVVPRWTMVDRATQTLNHLMAEFSVLNDVIAGWTAGTSIRKTGPADVIDWTDACRVMQHRRAHGIDDLPHRGLSVALFGNSKRLEQLWPMLDTLLQGGLDAAARSDEDICGELGIVKFPSTFLLAGRLDVIYGGREFDVREPYVGLSPSDIQAVLPLDKVDTLLSVENLSTFHELARRSPAKSRCALIYTAGMPSPSWLRVFKLLIEALPPQAAVRHWGDIDAGGFRIADCLARACDNLGRTLAPYGMDGALLEAQEASAEAARKSLDEAELRTIRRICEARSWTQEWAFISKHKKAFEQEGMRPTLETITKGLS